MMKKPLLTFILMLVLSMYNISCSSNKAEDGDAAQETAESTEDGADDEDSEDDEFESDEELAWDNEDGDENFEEGEEDDLEADLGEDGDEFAEEDADESAETSEDELASQEFSNEEEAPAEEFAENTEDDVVEPVYEAIEDVASMEPLLNDSMLEEPMVEKPTWIPVKKIAGNPFTKHGVLVNTVYLARPGDDINSISQKIYGTDKTAELLKVNPWLSRGIKTGDKTYYNSPNRPNDDVALKTYYEDVGLSPETYVSKSGDNIRKISSNLLGDNDAWKEVWATNADVESKMEIPEGTQLRYWASSEGVNMVANNDMAPPAEEIPPTPEPVDLPPPPPQATNNLPPPPPPPPAPPAQAMNDLPPPPPPVNAPENSVAAGSLAPPPPPPPRAPRKMTKKRSRKKAVAMSDDKDQLMYMVIGGVLLLGGLVLFARKRKAKSSSMDFNTHTQIE